MKYKELFKVLKQEANYMLEIAHPTPGLCWLCMAIAGEIGYNNYNKLLRRLQRYKCLIPKELTHSYQIGDYSPYWITPYYLRPRIKLLDLIIEIESSFWRRLLFRCGIYKQLKK